MRTPDEDPDFRMLYRYLKAHNAPRLFFTSLDKLIKRAGIRSEHITQVTKAQKEEDEKIALFRHHVAQGKTQEQIAALYGISVRSVSNFMHRHDITPSYNGIGKARQKDPPLISHKIEVIDIRIDPDFPVPVKIVRTAHASLR